MQRALVTLALALLIAASTTLAQERRAVARLTGPGAASGNITFTQAMPGGPVMVEGRVENLQAGMHGFHVHEKGDITGGCASAGGHFNPQGKKHGGPSAAERHVGDLGNIEAGADGVAQISITDSKISLSGEHSVLGRGLVLHADADDLGLGGQSDSLTTGHAGARVACGVIGVQ